MKRIESILKWGWLALPIFFIGWVLIALQFVFFFGLCAALVWGMFMVSEKRGKYPFTLTTLFVVTLLSFGFQIYVWSPKFNPLFFDFLFDQTIIHWMFY